MWNIPVLGRFSSLLGHARTFHSSSGLLFRCTPALCAEPLKKKKKLDPQIIKQREERKRKRLEKQIRRLEKNARQLKPIEELETPMELIDEQGKRRRAKPSLTPELIEGRALLEKQWAKFKMQEKLADYQLFDRIMAAQTKALNELKLESEGLYQQAIQPDPALVPFGAEGPVATPPIKNYEQPDGEYIDVSKKWE
ncbi:large ribosomal subunit protein mL40-like [Anopheles ziemanni]|uniref:large ribosomal subunit protein mL40-like n=1 Tax=Anopheles coustani TaxID=139045 RepID=UPI0026595637|nr:large ribosomal subunit protein mL40-like [Anopheles coustani]XP_058168890.1 large ribosomal subunit protein mL40-like [Anopheles ziemanni]